MMAEYFAMTRIDDRGPIRNALEGRMALLAHCR